MRAEPAHAHPLLVQVLPPGQGGVFDYMQCLKTEWSALGVTSHAISLSKELARQRSLADRIDDHAADVLQPCSVVLHFSGYGYGQRGLCFWLLDELRALRARGRGGLRLVVVFHELFATGPPWRSAFWLSQVQALIARRLARMSDALWTNTNQHARWLRAAVGSSRQIVVRPVFSNIGEPLASPPTTGRRPTAVVFGSASTRQRAFDAPNFNALIVTIATQQPLSIDSIGPRLPESLKSLIRDCMVTDKNRRLGSFDQIAPENQRAREELPRTSR